MVQRRALTGGLLARRLGQKQVFGLQDSGTDSVFKLIVNLCILCLCEKLLIFL